MWWQTHEPEGTTPTLWGDKIRAALIPKAVARNTQNPGGKQPFGPQSKLSTTIPQANKAIKNNQAARA